MRRLRQARNARLQRRIVSTNRRVRSLSCRLGIDASKGPSDGNQVLDCRQKSVLFCSANCGQYTCNERIERCARSLDAHFSAPKEGDVASPHSPLVNNKRLANKYFCLPWVKCSPTHPLYICQVAMGAFSDALEASIPTFRLQKMEMLPRRPLCS